MSKSQLKIDALNTGFEKIVLLDEFHEEIDSPPVIKTPLGNYLVCYTKLDTVLLAPEVFGAWSRHHGATGFAALDEIVEEVYDVHFCLRFAGEINEVVSRGKQTGPPEGAILPDVDEGGDADPEIHVPTSGGVTPLEAGVVQTPEEFMCLHNRTVADAYICTGTTGNLGFENPGEPLPPPLVQLYTELVAKGHVSCTNLRHLHVSDRRNVFYELEPGPIGGAKHPYKVNLRAVEYPQQPKDPCLSGILPVPSWHPPDSNLFESEELRLLHSRYDVKYDECRIALTGGDETWSEFLSRCDKSSNGVPACFLTDCTRVKPGVVKGNTRLNLARRDPVVLFEQARKGLAVRYA